MEWQKGRNSSVLHSAHKATLTYQLTAEKPQASVDVSDFITSAHVIPMTCTSKSSAGTQGWKRVRRLCRSSRNVLFSYVLGTLTA